MAELGEVLTTRELQSCGIEITAKMVMVLVDDAIYKKEGDGKWYRLLSEVTMNVTMNVT